MSTQTPTLAETASIQKTRWRIDPSRSRVEFETKTYWGLATVKGHFDRYEGTMDLSADPAIELTIDAASLDTGNRIRDKHLRSRDFFDVGRYPEIRFVSDSAVLFGNHLKVRGRLHVRDQSMAMQLDAELRAVGDELEIDTETVADHREVGMTWNQLGVIRVPTRMMVHGRLVRDGG
jgi:polyisoprenoid-binding protein YceI